MPWIPVMPSFFLCGELSLFLVSIIVVALLILFLIRVKKSLRHNYEDIGHYKCRKDHQSQDENLKFCRFFFLATTQVANITVMNFSS